MAAAVAGMTWCAVDWCFERKFSMVGFCSGVIAGLIGYVIFPIIIQSNGANFDVV